MGLGFNPEMLTNLPLYIGLRYTRSVRADGYVSFVSAFSIGAMALGVTALITVLSVMNGFDSEIKERLLRVVPHVIAKPVAALSESDYDQLMARLNEIEAVSSVVPLAQTYAMLSGASRQMGAVVQGIESENEAFNGLSDDFIAGDLLALESGQFGIVLGGQIARKLGLFMGDRVQLTLPHLSVSPAGIFPRLKSAEVVGIFEVGAQVDASTAFMHREDVRTLLRMGAGYQGVQIQLHDPYQVHAAVAELANLLPPATELHTWQRSMRTLFRAMRMEKSIVSLLLSVIIAVAAFNIVASLVLMVSDKRADIAVIRTLGASSSMVMQVFVVQGLAVGCLGIAIGAVVGCFLAANVGMLVTFIEGLLGMHLFDPSIYLINVLPSKILVSDVIQVVAMAFALSLLATLYPAWRAGQIMPAEALRYDI